MGVREPGERKIIRRSSSFPTIARLMLIPVAGLLIIILWSFIATHLPEPSPQPKKEVKPLVRASTVPRVTHEPAPVPARHGEIVLILDDVGFDHQPLSDAMRIDPNVNFSILPNARNATAFANALYARGFEVLCHLPMEPEGFPRVSPGPNAVLTTMSGEEITATTRADLAAVPHARGVNNHMGSRATTDRRVMSTVMAALPKGMYFIDSRTTAGSVAAATARSMNVKTASRSVFLDDIAQDAAIRTQLQALAAAAEEKGVAVGIGHMYPSTIRVLTADAPALRERGIRFVRASAIVE
jgi:polysaccharide deacetylase 2 family uncharacterized protein YibQ